MVLLLVIELDDRHRQLVEALLAAEVPSGTAGSATGVEHRSAAPPLVEAESVARASSGLTARLPQLPWVRTVVGAINENPLLAPYLARGPVAVAGGVAVVVALIGTAMVTIGGDDSDANDGPAVAAPSSISATSIPGTGPPAPSGNPSVPAAEPRQGSPAWGYASTRDLQYEEALETEVELHRQWQWGT